MRIVIEHRDITERRSSQLKLDAATQPVESSAGDVLSLQITDATA